MGMQMMGELSAPTPLVLNISNSDIGVSPSSGESGLRPYYRKAAFALRHSISEFSRVYGEERVGVLDLTFPRPVYQPSRVQKAWVKADRRLLPKVFKEYICVREQHASGAWHMHVVGLCREDIRTGFDIEGFREAQKLCGDVQLQDYLFIHRGESMPKAMQGEPGIAVTDQERAVSLMHQTYRSAPPCLIKILDELEKRLPKCGFGRFQFAPILSDADRLASYLSKQYGNTSSLRKGKKRVRLVSCTSGARFATSKFSWFEGGEKWRKGVSILAGHLRSMDIPINDVSDLSIWLGPKWAYELRERIMGFTELGYVPTVVMTGTIRRLLDTSYD